jgi:hypothetical protein
MRGGVLSYMFGYSKDTRSALKFNPIQYMHKRLSE